MRDVDDELIKRGGVIMVDSKEACLQESGEIIRAGLGSEGLIELGALLGKEGDGLRSRISESGDVTIFKSVSPSNQLLITERLFLLFGSFLSQMKFVSCLPS
jgi:ornithine cyclodeaminase/alanine dehydrogenase-like protein (mu-crystallin family)